MDFGTLADAQRLLSKQIPSKPPVKIRQVPLNKKARSAATPKKLSKSGPQEISAKEPVSRKHFLSSIPTYGFKARDPRFDAISAKPSKDSFRKAYSFLEDYQHNEISMLRLQIRQSRDPQERERLSKTLQSLQSRKETREAKDRASDLLRSRKKEEAEKVRKGKKPFFLKKSILLFLNPLICR